MNVDGERLQADLEANGEIGSIDAEEGRGRTVLTGTEADRRARERLVDRLEDAGMEVRVDAVGNIVGRWTPESADPDAAPVAAGSHLDSVPWGGIFDGPLGVYAALEAVRAMQDANLAPERPIEVVSFTEEEGGRFDVGLLGSSVAAGTRPRTDALALTDSDGTTVDEALSSIGFRGEDVLDASEWDAWLELHIEQDTRLERAGRQVGVVDAIAGIANCRVEVEGEANHAGATPMGERQDALAAAAELVLDVEAAATEVVAEESETAVGTVGKLDVTPNAKNVVPGAVRTILDVRDVDYDAMCSIVEAARESAERLAEERPVRTEFDRYRDQRPSVMSDRCVTALNEAADDAGVSRTELYSSALHDTANVAEVTDAAMLFAPSRDGISHNPLEWSDWGDCTSATRTLAGAMATLAGA